MNIVKRNMSYAWKKLPSRTFNIVVRGLKLTGKFYVRDITEAKKYVNQKRYIVLKDGKGRNPPLKNSKEIETSWLKGQ